MRLFFGRLLYRLGLRLLRLAPGRTVTFTHDSFADPKEMRAFAALARDAFGPSPTPMVVGIPTEAWAVAGDGTADGNHHQP